jgi:hypothetical protein
MHRIVVRSAPWIVLALLGGPAIALAQDQLPPNTPPGEPVPSETDVAPAPDVPSTIEPTAEAPDGAMAQPVEAPPAEPARTTDVTGWFRIDSDLGGLQLWAGAAHPLSDTVSLATDIYVFGSLGEFDIGPAIVAGPVVITPMLGLQINWAAARAVALVPQLYTILDGGSVYFESWIQIYLQDMFVEGSLDYLHTRDFLLFKASDHVALGVEADLNIALKNGGVDVDGDEAEILWLPVGPHLKLHYGEGSTLELFAGYDIAAEDFDRSKLAGRITFVQTW